MNCLPKGTLISGKIFWLRRRSIRYALTKCVWIPPDWVDAVICDYNYVFDPKVHLKRFFGDGVKGDYIFLIDEAHNLVDRGRKMYSATLSKEAILETARAVKGHSVKLYRILNRCNKLMLEYKRECDTWQVLENIGGTFPPASESSGRDGKFSGTGT